MIISFAIENWMSFKKEAKFSMVSTSERQHGERVSRIPKYHMRVLPIAAIYGGNASGKTNFFKGLNFVKWLVVQGTQPDALIPVDHYCLDDECAQKPSKFKLEILINEIIFEFSFALTRESIVEEKLVKILSKKEVVLYHRHDSSIEFAESLKDNQFLNFVYKGTRKNQLFLTNSISQNIDEFKEVYNWFRDDLELIAPDARFQPFERFLDESSLLYNKMNEHISECDTGISRIECKEIPFENIPLPVNVKLQLQETLKNGQTVRCFHSSDDKFIVTRRDDKLIAKKMVAMHAKANGREVGFEMSQESDGSRRLIDLFPAFSDLYTGRSKVYVVDEIDRSLHTILAQQLIELYLQKCGKNIRTQLLITTHDLLLMDQKILRRDEMWLTERDSSGESVVFSVSDFKEIRYDKNIRKSYLQGRMGGISRVLIDATWKRGNE
jgi:AAA15 family ATPase/GTPase